MKVKKLKVSFIWTKTFFQLFDKPLPSGAAFPFPVTAPDYRNTVISLSSQKSSWTNPWTIDEKKTKMCNWFWKYYFNGIDPVSSNPATTANHAYRCRVPFRKSLNNSISFAWPKSSNSRNSISFEGYLYRHGVTLIATAYIFYCSTPEEAIELAFSIRYDSCYSIESEKRKSLTAVSMHLLESLCKDVGVTVSYDAQPFAIVALDMDPSNNTNQAVAQNDDVHRILHALASFDRQWKTIAVLPDLGKHKIPVKNEHSDDMLYGTELSRVLWFPRMFSNLNQNKRDYSLLWYYRNLLIATMQVMSLSNFLVRAQDDFNIQTNTSLTNYSKDVATILREFEMGSEKTYRSRSLERQIHDNKQLQNVLQNY